MTTPCFQILDASRAVDSEMWIRFWSMSPEREIFAHPAYVQLYCNATSNAYCATFESPEGYVMYPFICRDVRRELFPDVSMNPVWDIITPYGYGGPLAWGYTHSETLAKTFWTHFDTWAHEHSVITEVIRFALAKETLLPYYGTIEEKMNNIVVDLQPSEETLWMNVEHKVRKNVKRATNSAVHIVADPDGKQLDEFLSVYCGTLDRREAKAQYYFNRTFFEKLNETLRSQYMYFHAIHNQKIISTELILVSEHTIYSFLGGTYRDAFPVRPNDLLKYEIILWAKRNGKTKFVLGGGYEPNDGIFQYKRSFAPQGILPFYIGCRVFNPDVYAMLIETKKKMEKTKGIAWTPQDAHIPAYRT